MPKALILTIFLIISFSKNDLLAGGESDLSTRQICPNLFHKLLDQSSSKEASATGNKLLPNSFPSENKKIVENGIEVDGHFRKWLKVNTDEIIALRNGKEVHSGIREILQKARKSIYIQVSGFESEEVVNILKTKAKEGVDIKIILPDISKHYIENSIKEKYLTILDDLKVSGVEIQTYVDQELTKGTTQLYGENHKKLIIVDHEYGYIGSSNIRQYLDNYDHGLMLKGEAVNDLSNEFANDYSFASFRHLKKFNSNKNSSLQFLSGKELKSKLIETINSAQQSIDLVAYNLKDKEIIDVLIRRKKEIPNIKINILLGPSKNIFTLLGFFKSSLPINDDAYRKLSEAGIKVHWGGDHLKENRSIIHAKSIIIDNKYLFGGSSDLNARSFEANKELSYYVKSEILAKDFADSFLSEFSRGKAEAVHSKWESKKGEIADYIGESIASVRNFSRKNEKKISLIGNVSNEAALVEKINQKGVSQKYYSENSFFRDVSDGSIIEGSHRFGGIQPDYYIDLSEGPIQNVLKFSKKIGEDQKLKQPEKIKTILEHIRTKVLVNRNQKGESYLELLAHTLKTGERISLSSYIDKQLGVCREHALLVHFALKEANVKNYFAYGVLENRFGGHFDHAFLVVEERGEKYIVDSYNPFLNGRRLRDVLRSIGSKTGDPIASYADKLTGFLGSLGGIRIVPLNYPVVWNPAGK